MHRIASVPRVLTLCLVRSLIVGTALAVMTACAGDGASPTAPTAAIVPGPNPERAPELTASSPDAGGPDVLVTATFPLAPPAGAGVVITIRGVFEDGSTTAGSFEGSARIHKVEGLATGSVDIGGTFFISGMTGTLQAAIIGPCSAAAWPGCSGLVVDLAGGDAAVDGPYGGLFLGTAHVVIR